MKNIDFVKHFTLNNLVRIAIIIVVIMVVLHFGRKLYKNWRNQNIINNLEDDINVQRISYPLSYYPLWATDLFNAMDGVGTDEDTVFTIFNKMKTIEDVLQLISSFGVKSEQTLTQWISDDLGTDDRGTINSILASKSINYQF